MFLDKLHPVGMPVKLPYQRQRDGKTRHRT